MHWFTRPGWPGNLLALLAGTLTTLLWPLRHLAAGPVVGGTALPRLRETGPKQAAQRGWCYGFGLFASGVSWVYVSIHDFGAASPPLAGLLTFGFVAGLALFFALLGWLWVRLLRNRHSALGDALAFTALWLAFDALRGCSPAFPGSISATASSTARYPAWHRWVVWLLSFAIALSATLLVALPRLRADKPRLRLASCC